MHGLLWGDGPPLAGRVLRAQRGGPQEGSIEGRRGASGQLNFHAFVYVVKNECQVGSTQKGCRGE